MGGVCCVHPAETNWESASSDSRGKDAKALPSSTANAGLRSGIVVYPTHNEAIQSVLEFFGRACAGTGSHQPKFRTDFPEKNQTHSREFYLEVSLPFTPEAFFLFQANATSKDLKLLDSELEEHETLKVWASREDFFVIVRSRRRQPTTSELRKMLYIMVVKRTKSGQLVSAFTDLSRTPFAAQSEYQAPPGLEASASIYIAGSVFEGHLLKTFAQLDAPGLTVQGVGPDCSDSLPRVLTHFLLSADPFKLRWMGDDRISAAQIFLENLVFLMETGEELSRLGTNERTLKARIASLHAEIDGFLESGPQEFPILSSRLGWGVFDDPHPPGAKIQKRISLNELIGAVQLSPTALQACCTIAPLSRSDFPTKEKNAETTASEQRHDKLEPSHNPQPFAVTAEHLVIPTHRDEDHILFRLTETKVVQLASSEKITFPPPKPIPTIMSPQAQTKSYPEKDIPSALPQIIPGAELQLPVEARNVTVGLAFVEEKQFFKADNFSSAASPFPPLIEIISPTTLAFPETTPLAAESPPEFPNLGVIRPAKAVALPQSTDISSEDPVPKVQDALLHAKTIPFTGETNTKLAAPLSEAEAPPKTEIAPPQVNTPVSLPAVEVFHPSVEPSKASSFHKENTKESISSPSVIPWPPSTETTNPSDVDHWIEDAKSAPAPSPDIRSWNLSPSTSPSPEPTPSSPAEKAPLQTPLKVAGQQASREQNVELSDLLISTHRKEAHGMERTRSRSLSLPRNQNTISVKACAPQRTEGELKSVEAKIVTPSFVSSAATVAALSSHPSSHPNSQASLAAAVEAPASQKPKVGSVTSVKTAASKLGVKQKKEIAQRGATTAKKDRQATSTRPNVKAQSGASHTSAPAKTKNHDKIPARPSPLVPSTTSVAVGPSQSPGTKVETLEQISKLSVKKTVVHTKIMVTSPSRTVHNASVTSLKPAKMARKGV